MFLRWVAGGRGGLALDGLTEASIRTFLIADAGLASLARIGSEPSAFARWRGHLLMFAAAAHGFFFQVLLFNPRIGAFGDVAGGPPLLDALAAAYRGSRRAVRRRGVAHLPRPARPGAGLRRDRPALGRSSGRSWRSAASRTGRICRGGLTSIGAAEAVGCSLVLLGVALLADRLRLAGRGAGASGAARTSPAS